MYQHSPRTLLSLAGLFPFKEYDVAENTAFGTEYGKFESSLHHFTSGTLYTANHLKPQFVHL
jgi:hypothetical protein